MSEVVADELKHVNSSEEELIIPRPRKKGADRKVFIDR